LDYLINILDKQLDSYQALLLLAKEEQTLLVKNKYTELEAVLEKENIISDTIEKQDAVRKTCFYELGQHFDVDPETITIPMLIKLIQEPFSSRLNNLYNKLASVINELNDTNQNNLSLVNNSLDFVQHTVQSIIMAFMDNKNAYTSERDLVTTVKPLMLDFST